MLVSILCYSSLKGSSPALPPPPPPLYNAKTNIPIFQPPLNLAGPDKSFLYTQFSYTAVPDINGRIDLHGTQTKYAGLVNGKNFNWEIPRESFKVGIYPVISQYSSLLFIVNGNKVGRNYELDGGDIGLSYMLTRSTDFFARFDVGIDLHNTNFYWVQSEDGYVDRCSDLDYDPFIILTFHSDFDDLIFNPFLQISYCKETLLDDDEYSTSQYKQEVYFNMNILTLTPGLSYKWGKNKLISLGIRLYYYDGIQNTRSFTYTPFFQLSLLL